MKCLNSFNLLYFFSLLGDLSDLDFYDLDLSDLDCHDPDLRDQVIVLCEATWGYIPEATWALYQRPPGAIYQRLHRLFYHLLEAAVAYKRHIFVWGLVHYGPGLIQFSHAPDNLCTYG